MNKKTISVIVKILAIAIVSVLSVRGIKFIISDIVENDYTMIGVAIRCVIILIITLLTILSIIAITDDK